MDFNTHFKNRSILVTGHTGFKGSWLSLWLYKIGAKVSGYSLQPPTEPSNYKVSDLNDIFEHEYIHDIRDTERLQQAIDKIQPEVIFHLAAQSLVLESYAQPHETFEVNVLGTSNLLAALRQSQKPCVVIVVTSDKCYQNTNQVWGYRENDPMGGHDPYSASKGAAELVLASYRDSYFSPSEVASHGVKIASARAGNVIGGGDWAKDRIITDMVQSVIRDQVIEIRRPNAIRPWQHVLEPLSGYMTLAATMLNSDEAKWCDAWNFGPQAEQAVNVQSLAEMFIDCWGSGSWQSPTDQNLLQEARTLRLCIDKAISQLAWQPVWEVRQAVEKTVYWYQQFYEVPESHTFSLCFDQIDEYENDFGVLENKCVE